jgi:polysaccharide export outer membrane protein
MIAYQDFGRLKAAGMTVKEIQKEVRDFLIARKIHTNPTVTVDVTDFRSQMVYVSGAVSHPMGVRITGAETLLNVLAQAGFSPSAGQRIQVIRNRPSYQEFTFDRRALENGSAAPFQLHDGDSIIVPEAEKALVRGEVRNPGLYEVTSSTSLLQIIVMAGDFNDRASRGSVDVLRKDPTGDGKASRIKVKQQEFTTFIVKPGDVVEVRRRIL